MSRNALYAIIAILVVGGGVFAYQAYQAHLEKERSFQIEIGPKGMKIDPPAR